MIYEGVDFFKCVGNYFCVNPCELHNKCLDLFANVIFQDRLGAAFVLQNPDSTKLNLVGLVNPIIVMWLKRVSYKTQADIRILALNFLAYHWNYKEKPHRLFSVQVFALIVCELYECCILYKGKCI